MSEYYCVETVIENPNEKALPSKDPDATTPPSSPHSSTSTSTYLSSVLNDYPSCSNSETPSDCSFDSDSEFQIPGGHVISSEPMSFMNSSDWSSLWNDITCSVGIDASILKKYKPMSKEVYGEARPSFVDKIIRDLNVTESDIFYDIGSGIGNVVMQIAALTGSRSVGIEIRQDLHDVALNIQGHLERELKRRNKCSGPIELYRGDATQEDHVLSSATVVFMNNVCYPEEMEQSLKIKFQKLMQDGCRVVTTKKLFPRYTPWNARSKGSPASIFQWPFTELKSDPEDFSWIGREVAYFVYIVNRKQGEIARPSMYVAPTARKKRGVSGVSLAVSSGLKKRGREISEEKSDRINRNSTDFQYSEKSVRNVKRLKRSKNAENNLNSMLGNDSMNILGNNSKNHFNQHVDKIPAKDMRNQKKWWRCECGKTFTKKLMSGHKKNCEKFAKWHAERTREGGRYSCRCERLFYTSQDFAAHSKRCLINLVWIRGTNRKNRNECNICGHSGMSGEPCIFCSVCDGGFHLKCLNLTEAKDRVSPPDDWFCENCFANRNKT
eukprot:TRINITY_DN9747_c0_g1_i1.p1 TRINITY_DN9747_c0_g1~~TRINITY_DN9747_c0_g1_i1.p1  ORF type:complete len:552 (+),score=87.58 TRINITY_DN9747_c0_g1_i1:74-1729(+)